MKFKLGDTVRPTFTKLFDIDSLCFISKIVGHLPNELYLIKLMNGTKISVKENQLEYLGNKKVYNFYKIFHRPTWGKKLCKQ